MIKPSSSETMKVDLFDPVWIKQPDSLDPDICDTQRMNPDNWLFTKSV